MNEKFTARVRSNGCFPNLAPMSPVHGPVDFQQARPRSRRFCQLPDEPLHFASISYLN